MSGEQKLPRWLFPILGATVLASGLAAWIASRPPADHSTPVQSSTPVSFAQPGGSSARWTSVPLPVKAPLHAIADGVDVLYAVGDHGTVMRRHAAEDVWSTVDSKTTANLRAVSVLGDRVVATGDDGTVVALDGKSAGFRPLASGTKVALRAVRLSAFGVVAAGDGGTIVRGAALDAEALAPEKSPTTEALRGMCAAMTETWIVGDRGTLLRLTLMGVERVDSGTTENLRAVTCDGSKVIAVGDHGVVVQRADPSAKFAVSHDGTADYLAIASYYGNTTWVAVGRGAATSATFADDRTGLHGDLEGVVFSTLGTWAVGTDGVFASR